MRKLRRGRGLEAGEVGRREEGSEVYEEEDTEMMTETKMEEEQHKDWQEKQRTEEGDGRVIETVKTKLFWCVSHCLGPRGGLSSSLNCVMLSSLFPPSTITPYLPKHHCDRVAITLTNTS